jgi:hypothetical protein
MCRAYHPVVTTYATTRCVSATHRTKCIPALHRVYKALVKGKTSTEYRVSNFQWFSDDKQSSIVIYRVIDGAMGLVAHPIAGLSNGGLTGAVKGLGIGVMGAISKPLSGAVGLLAQTSQVRTPYCWLTALGTSCALTRIRLSRERWVQLVSDGIGCISDTRCQRRSSLLPMPA